MLKAQVSKILNNSLIKDGQIKQLRIPAGDLLPSSAFKESQSNNNYLDQEFVQQVQQSLQQIHLVFSDEYKRVCEYVQPAYGFANSNNPSGFANNSFAKHNASGFMDNSFANNSLANNNNGSFLQNASYFYNSSKPINAPQHTSALRFQDRQNVAESSFFYRDNAFQNPSHEAPSQYTSSKKLRTQGDRYPSAAKKEGFSMVDFDAKFLQDRRSNPQLNQFEQQFYDAQSKGQKPSQEGKCIYKFSLAMKHPKVVLDASQCVCTSAPNSKKVKLALLEPSLETLPLEEISFAFKITVCKNLQYSAPLAIGLCHQKIAEINHFEFEEESMKDPSLVQSLDSFKSAYSRSVSFYKEGADHGCYLLSSTGIVRNTYDKKQDMRKAKIRFSQGDIITCLFNPFKRFIEFRRKGTNEKCVLNIALKKGDKLYICVRLSYADDVVEILH